MNTATSHWTYIPWRDYEAKRRQLKQNCFKNTSSPEHQMEMDRLYREYVSLLNLMGTRPTGQQHRMGN